MSVLAAAPGFRHNRDDFLDFTFERNLNGRGDKSSRHKPVGPLCWVAHNVIRFGFFIRGEL